MEAIANPPSAIPVRCQKCRYHLFEYEDVLDSHGNKIVPVEAAISCNESERELAKRCSTDVWYIPEEKIPSWMKSDVDSGDWIKGKMNCPKCNLRIGSYNFVAGMKCSCGLHILPPIHIVKSKVDVIIRDIPD